MTEQKPFSMPAARAGLLLLSCLLVCVAASAQSISDSDRFLILPKDARKPEPPASLKELFKKPARDGVVLEVILQEDGSIFAFESRSLKDALEGTVKAKEYRGHDEIVSLLRYAATLKKKKKVSRYGIEVEITDVDFLLHVSGKTPLKKLMDLLLIATREEIAISQYHIVVKDEKSGSTGYLPWFLALDTGSKKGPDDKAARVRAYALYPFSAKGKGLVYGIMEEGGSFRRNVSSLEELEKEIDALKKENPDILLHAGLGGIEKKKEDSKTPKMQDFIDFLTLAATKGVDLRRERVWVRNVR